MKNNLELQLIRQLEKVPRCKDHIAHFTSPSPNWSVSVLGVLLSKTDSKLLESIAEGCGWTFCQVDSWTDAFALIEEYRFGVILWPFEILGTDWKERLQLFLQPSHSAKVLLITSNPDNNFGQAFLEEGGFAILSSPLKQTSVVQAVQRAWYSWTTSVAGPYAY